MESRHEKADALVAQGRAYLKKDDFQKARQAFWAAFIVRSEGAGVRVPGSHPKTLPVCAAPKLKNDLEQMAYLIRAGKLPSRYRRYLANGAALLEQLSRNRHPNRQIGFVFPSTLEKVSPFFGKPFALYLPRASHRPAVRSRLEPTELEHDGRKTGIFVVDDVLTQPAFSRIRRFCLESAIWHDVKRGNYVGAELHRGFCCELLFQIASELRAELSELLKGRKLASMWGYRYPAKSPGIPVHADARSGLTANLWLTPDSANLEPSRGGVIVYKTRAPASWPERKYNTDPPAIRRLLSEKLDQGLYVPYRCNRLVLFDARRFHKSDGCQFAKGYENARMNMTLVFANAR